MTWRPIRPWRARRSSGGERDPVGGPPRRSASRTPRAAPPSSAAVPRTADPTPARADRAPGTSRRTSSFSPSRQLAGRRQPGQRVQRRILVVRQTPIAGGRGPAPGTSTRPGRPPSGRSGRSRRSRVRATPRPRDRRARCHPARSSKPSCMVTSSGPSGEDVLQPRPTPGSAGTATGLTRLDLQRPQDRDRQIAGDVAGLDVPLQSDEHPAVRPRHRRPRHRQHRGQRDRPDPRTARPVRPTASAARSRPERARAARSTRPRRRGPQTDAERTRHASSAPWVRWTVVSVACSRRTSLCPVARGGPDATPGPIS